MEALRTIRWLVLLVAGCTGEIGANFADLDGDGYAEEDEGGEGEGEPDDDPVPETPDRVVNFEDCGNALDDDGDGQVDEDCSCAADEVRACYTGPAETLGVGICHGGLQTCDTHFEFPSWGDCLGAVTPVVEILGNGQDDDCDGSMDCSDGDFIDDPSCVVTDPCADGGGGPECNVVPDCADPAFADDPACAIAGLCPDGQTPTYNERDLDPGWGGSSIEEGDGQPVMEMSCEDGGACAAGQVSAETTPGVYVCVEPPPECDEGLYPTLTDAGEWTCRPPCEIIVHYGAIYGNKSVCTSPPDFACPDGQVPTFIFETEEWECQPMCDNGLYDQIWFGNAVLCVPC
ncbi:MAG: hypothetical protein HYY06_23090 [Deltaproteobacteria bacterium]|nr:hypothetical protein [Deltaproteobacteria bacterium]